MPKATFFNLSEQKRLTLLDAIKQEFSRVPLFEASIANIVKSAEIPRGSFYQYFTDKEDAFLYVLNEFAKEKKRIFVSLLRDNEGDLFASMLQIYQMIIAEEDNLQLLRNTFLFMTHKIESTFARSFSEKEMNDNFQRISRLINKAKLNIANEQELFHVLQIISAVTFRNLVETFAQNLSFAESMDNYKVEMDLLQRGLAPR